LLLDGARWQTAEDFYDAFLRAVGAPSWHGHNFNALRDSIAVGDVNAVSLPYDIVVHGTSRADQNINGVIAGPL
jgi:RNAse (barnase) inhibitor barstar